MTDRVERIFSTVLVVAAIAIAGTTVHREFFSSARNASAAPANGAPTYVKSWEDALTAGDVVGDTSAVMKLVVLSDLECPFCSRFNAIIKQVRQDHAHDVEIVFVHTPLSIHRFALPAARAAECASDEGKFERFVNTVYAKQDSLGIKPWTSYAAESGVRDTIRVARCASTTSHVPRIDAGLAFADKINVHATPTIMINGWRFDYPPSIGDITDALDSLKKGAKPFGAARKL